MWLLHRPLEVVPSLSPLRKSKMRTDNRTLHTDRLVTMAKLAKRIKSWRLAAMAGAAGASLLASRQAHAEWVMGTVQQSTTYFTEVATFFQVPNAPTSGTTSAESAIWPGLWCS